MNNYLNKKRFTFFNVAWRNDRIVDLHSLRELIYNYLFIYESEYLCYVCSLGRQSLSLIHIFHLLTFRSDHAPCRYQVQHVISKAAIKLSILFLNSFPYCS